MYAFVCVHVCVYCVCVCVGCVCVVCICLGDMCCMCGVYVVCVCYVWCGGLYVVWCLMCVCVVGDAMWNGVCVCVVCVVCVSMCLYMFVLGGFVCMVCVYVFVCVCVCVYVCMCVCGVCVCVCLCVSLFWIVVSNFKENSFICNLVDNNSLTTTTIVYQIVDHIHKTIQFMPTSTGFRRRLNIYSQTQLNHNYHDHKFWAYQHHCPSSCQLISLTTTIMRP